MFLYLASRYLVKSRTVGRKGNIKVTDTLRLGTDSFVYIVEAMDKKYLIAQNKNTIVLLDKQSSFEEILEEKLCVENHGEEEKEDDEVVPPIEDERRE